MSGINVQQRTILAKIAAEGERGRHCTMISPVTRRRLLADRLIEAVDEVALRYRATPAGLAVLANADVSA